MSAACSPDVLVVGLGPAGAAAALAAARVGARVMAVERNVAPGLPVQCAEFVPEPIFDDAPQARGAQVQPIGRMITQVGDDAPDITPGFRGQMIDRARFDQALISAAQSAGADCHFGLAVRGLGPEGVLLADGQTLRPRIIIGADGPLSAVGRAVGCVNTALVHTRQITVDLLQPHDATDIFLRAEFPGGYGWLFPKGTACNLGLGVDPAHRQHLKPLLSGLHAELVAAGRVGSAIRRATGGLIPVGGIVGLQGWLGATHIFLAGDAAGLTHPVTGAGIASAVGSGRMAGEAAAALLSGQTGAGDDYEEEIRAVYEPSLAHALIRRRKLMESEPGPRALRAGWIAYPQYWTKDRGHNIRSRQELPLEASA